MLYHARGIMVRYVRQKITIELIYSLTDCCHIFTNHYNFCGIITILCSLLRPYSENYDKYTFSCNSSIWCSSVTVLATHCITQLACLYFGEYPQAVRCLAQPLWCSSHGSCSILHGLKPFAAPANRNGEFFQEGPEFCGGG